MLGGYPFLRGQNNCGVQKCVLYWDLGEPFLIQIRSTVHPHLVTLMQIRVYHDNLLAATTSAKASNIHLDHLKTVAPPRTQSIL